MTTRTVNPKTGKVTAESDTRYHPDGTGPRDASGKPLRDAAHEPAPASAPASAPPDTAAE